LRIPAGYAPLSGGIRDLGFQVVGLLGSAVTQANDVDRLGVERTLLEMLFFNFSLMPGPLPWSKAFPVNGISPVVKPVKGFQLEILRLHKTVCLKGKCIRINDLNVREILNEISLRSGETDWTCKCTNSEKEFLWQVFP